MVRYFLKTQLVRGARFHQLVQELLGYPQIRAPLMVQGYQADLQNPGVRLVLLVQRVLDCPTAHFVHLPLKVLLVLLVQQVLLVPEVLLVLEVLLLLKDPWLPMVRLVLLVLVDLQGLLALRVQPDP